MPRPHWSRRESLCKAIGFSDLFTLDALYASVFKGNRSAILMHYEPIEVASTPETRVGILCCYDEGSVRSRLCGSVVDMITGPARGVLGVDTELVLLYG